MVEIRKNTDTFKIGDKIIEPIPRDSNQEWFTEDIVPLTSSRNTGTVIIVDFAFSVSTVVEYTLDSGDVWIKFNNGNQIDGDYSKSLRVTTGVQVNFRAKESGTLNRCIVS